MKPRAGFEDAIQRAVFEHIVARAAPGVFAFHVPNGGYRLQRRVRRHLVYARACLT